MFLLILSMDTLIESSVGDFQKVTFAGIGDADERSRRSKS